MKSSFHSGRNGMGSFNSSWNGMSSPFRPEWNGHSIPDRMEWPHSIPIGMEWPFHSGRNGHSNPSGLECHSFDNLKKYASSTHWPHTHITTTIVLLSKNDLSSIWLLLKGDETGFGWEKIKIRGTHCSDPSKISNFTILKWTQMTSYNPVFSLRSQLALKIRMSA